MTDHHETLKAQGRRTRASIQAFEIFAVDVPFQKPFGHSAYLRNNSESIFVKCITDQGSTGFGESLPRQYVTGETRDLAFRLLSTSILPRLIGKSFGSFENVKTFLRECDGKAPVDWVSSTVPQASAWCAIDLALLDTFSREFNEPVFSKESQTASSSPKKYSGVISLGKPLEIIFSIIKMKLYGLNHIKFKVDDQIKTSAFKGFRKLLGSRCDIRVDANMAWSRSQAISAIEKLSKVGIQTFEQPVAANDLDLMAELICENRINLIADESFTDRESLKKLIAKKACTGINIRISKCGGLIAALARAEEARRAGLLIQLGCQVGESSLLSSAQLILLSQVPEAAYLEGCFGLRLLKEDPAKPLLQFGYGGKPPERLQGPGLGTGMDEKILRQFTVRHDVIGG